ncbi:MAG: hypothetical protein V4642_13325 [Bacteroidota bacterium]
MKIIPHLAICLLALYAQSCTLLKEAQNDGFTDGLYEHRFGDSVYTSYLENGDDTLFVHVLSKSSHQFTLPFKKDDGEASQHTLSKRTFDIDIITIPLKLRPSVEGFPPQLNTNFNGNIFIGSRYDSYDIDYSRSPIGTLNQEISHYGYSIGGFGGIGTTAMNPWVTQNAIEIEYDGVIALAGISGTAAINDFTFGLGIGVDFLLDKNREFWIYQNQPWLGLTFGVNLN